MNQAFVQEPAPNRARALRTTIATNIGLAGVNGATGFLAARLLGPTGRGELAAIQLWPTFLATICLLGLPDALVYFASLDRRHAGRSLGTAVSLALVAASFALLIGLVAMGVLIPRQSDAIVHAARIYLLFCPVFVLAGLPFQILRGVGAFSLWNVLRVLPSLIWLAILVAGAAHGSTDPRHLALSYLTAMCVYTVPVIILTTRRLRGPYRPQRDLVRPLLRYGLPSMATSLPQVLNLRLDQMVMAAFVPPRQLGYYVAAVAWSGTVSPVLAAVGSVLFPWVASHRDARQQSAVVCQVSRITVLLSFGLVAVIGLLTWPCLTLVLGGAFANATVPALVLVVAGGILGLGGVLEEALRGLGAPSAVLKAELAGFIASAAGLALLLPTMGIVGAAITSALAYSLVLASLVRRLSRTLQVPYRDLLRPTREDIAIARQRIR